MELLYTRVAQAWYMFGKVVSCQNLQNLLAAFQGALTEEDVLRLLADSPRLEEALKSQQGTLGPRFFGAERGSVEDKAIGSMLGVTIGDVLGAPMEGFGRQHIERKFPNGPVYFVPCHHMGASHLPARYGMYTDDTNATLAVAEAICNSGKLDCSAVALSGATFMCEHQPVRACPDSAFAVGRALLDGRVSVLTAGRFNYPDGSFANGGCMRIAPVGLAFRHASPQEMRKASAAALLATHVHPEAVDGAAVVATAVAHCLHVQQPEELNVLEMLGLCLEACDTGVMKQLVHCVLEEVTKIPSNYPTPEVLEKDVAFLTNLGCCGFQIKTRETVPLVLWAVARWHRDPERCLMNVVALGGDTDTMASICGGILGALHGTSWIPHRWYDNLEVDTCEWARDYCVDLGRRLSRLDLGTGDLFWPPGAES